MKKIILLISTLFIVTFLNAIFNDYEPSPRSRAMGGAVTSLSDNAYSTFYNPASGINLENNFSFSYTKPFGNDFNTLSAAVFSMKLPKKVGVVSVGLQSFDVDYEDVNLLSEKVYAMSHSFRLLKDVHSEINFGYGFNMYHLAIESMGNQASFGFNVGMLATLHNRTNVGFYVQNINNPKVGVNNDQALPQKISASISYIPFPTIITSFELQKDINTDVDSKTEIHTGAEITVYKYLKLRFGLRNNPAQYSMGFGLNVKNILINYAFSTHTIGDTHQMSIGFKF